jgi:hypothetical protein
MKLWLARAAGSWEHAEAVSSKGVGCTPVRSLDVGLLDAELFEIYGPYSPIHHVCGSPTTDLDDECSWGPSP